MSFPSHRLSAALTAAAAAAAVGAAQNYFVRSYSPTFYFSLRLQTPHSAPLCTLCTLQAAAPNAAAPPTTTTTTTTTSHHHRYFRLTTPFPLPCATTTTKKNSHPDNSLPHSAHPPELWTCLPGESQDLTETQKTYDGNLNRLHDIIKSAAVELVIEVTNFTRQKKFPFHPRTFHLRLHLDPSTHSEKCSILKLNPARFRTIKMLENDSRPLVAGVAGLAVVFLLTIPSLAGIASHLRESKPPSKIYEDEDGIATEKSVAEYSTKIPKALLAVFSILGLGTALALAVLETLAGIDVTASWVNVGQWVRTFMDFQSGRADIRLVSDRDSNSRHSPHQGFREPLHHWNLRGNLVNISSCSSPIPGWSHH